jgi:thiol-disulfide isomerase/thioredoxin/predicted protein tyrosine phosphatase
MQQLNEISLILPHLYISDWESSVDPEKLLQAKIRAILTVETQLKSHYIRALYTENNIDFMQVEVDDIPTDNISQFFDSTYNFIHKHISKNENVLVHCAAGISRSVTIVANYLLRRLYEKAHEEKIAIKPEDAVTKALQTIKRGRPIAHPNTGFLKQLLDKANDYAKSNYQNSLKSTSGKSNMCDKSFVDAQGKPANIICLTNDDFDDQGNLKNFKDVVGVVFFWGSFCHHCQVMKPEYVKFASMLPPNAPVRAFAVEGVKNKDLTARINPAIWKYAVRGYPTIVSYDHGVFYSEYAPSEDDMKAFRTAPDLLEFARGIGKAPVKMVKA